MKSRIKLILAVTVASCLWAGCTIVETRDFKVVSVLNKKQANRLSYEIEDKDEKRTLKLDGYQTDQVQAVGAIAEGVAKGLAASVKP